MDLTSIEDLEEAVGRELTSDESDQAAYFISLVSQYIISYTRVSFEPVESTIRTKSDYYGVVELPGGPVQEISDVRYYYGQQAVWEWDGDDQIFGLAPKVAVDVTYTHGYDSIPEEIAKIATEAAKRMMLAPDGQKEGPLMRYKVGDVEEMYKAPFRIGLAAGIFNDLETFILDEYRVTATTFRVGFSQPDIPQIPDNESAIFE